MSDNPDTFGRGKYSKVIRDQQSSMDALEQQCNRALAERDTKIIALTKALEQIAGMDPEGIRADDLGRAARAAAEAIRNSVGGLPK